MSDEATVHIVDDDLAVRQSLAFLLATAGIGVRLYDSASGFLATLGSALPGCLVTDVRMPVIDGLELLRRMKAAGSSLPVIVMTGHGDVALAVGAMKAGAVDFIEKPFDDDLFLRTVKSCCQGASATDSGVAATRMKLESLSRRERQVLDGVLAGKQNKIIAYELGLSPRTVEIYRAKVMIKTEANNVPDLVRAVLASGLL
ncbi:response regulator FixJ [Beijerinckia sp. L45]|uniref:response regulator FixJ n=1 Tax=Beijerinckia sp. L45 TaxID=1641855 RepID=UPI00131C6A45|nr:response regulator FixJ [Beijerinckia sp. L45]